MDEVWVDVIDFEGYYKVSNLGRIQSIDRVKNGKVIRKGRIRTPTPDSWGYPRLRLSKSGHKKMYRVHLLVAYYFVPNPYNKPKVNHIDGDKSNNHFSNLEWVSERENSTHRHFSMNKSSKYPGVTFFKRDAVWRAQAYINGKNTHIGYFENEEDAFLAYKNKLSEVGITNKYAI